MNCILCNSPSTPLLRKDDPQRGEVTYWICEGECGLIFLDPEKRLYNAQEKERYDLHNNNPDDDGYRKFIQRLTNVLIPKLSEGAHGLDFGCGPGPALSIEMEKHGFELENYDPFYFPDARLLEKKYDCITATEVLEHLHNPKDTFKRLSTMLSPKGVLAVMTEMVTSPDAFEKWWYHTDPTHVCFYSPQTMQWIAREWEWTMDSPTKNVTIFTSGV